MLPPGMTPPVAGGQMGPMQGPGPSSAPQVPSYLRFGSNPAQPGGTGGQPGSSPAPGHFSRRQGRPDRFPHLPDPSEVHDDRGFRIGGRDDVVPSPHGGSMPALPAVPELPSRQQLA